ncbi:MAG: ElyC/SanA/YdcF family protein [Candidatus Omnitrophica bacterium]|nr:ElyC/SanA/YdcF family protein [Candidatus Omnitrophota bacterium]
MIKNENIICISSIDWDFIWQGHQEIMLTLAKNGNKVFFIENTGVRMPGVRDISRIKKRFKNWFRGVKGVRKESANLYILSPLVVPFPYFRPARWINRIMILSVLKKWMKALNFTNPIIWVFLPTALTLDLINGIDRKLLIYYCLDNLKLVSSTAKKVEQYEKKVIGMSDLVFVTADKLYSYCSQFNEMVYKFPFTVNIDKFDRGKTGAADLPVDMKGIRRPVIGFSGGVRKWLDKELIKYLAESHPEYSFVFVGPLQMDVGELARLKNIYFLGQKSHDELPNYVNNFDVAVIPYLINEFTECIYPAKLNEYLALGKSVVSTGLPELRHVKKTYGNIIYIAENKEEFSACIDKALGEDDSSMIEKRVAYAQKNSWKNRIEEMSRLIEGAVEEKMARNEAGWKENLLAFYRKAQKRLARLAVAVAFIYLIIFYTPLVWFLAGPLKITDVPRKADAIVVFAGGVGESGKVGQGYLERTEYAVELYKAGFAKNIIFSSGYMYIFKEPVMMKVIAVSLGVPEDAIILEDKAMSTYQNVVFSEEILKNKGWNKILVVSSPYHMRRVSLVFKKTGKGLEVAYTPVKKNSFYKHRTDDFYAGGSWKQISFAQIEGIFREYLAIFYYWLNGYI